jgi:predicted MFS family arabinose efflux permease
MSAPPPHLSRAERLRGLPALITAQVTLHSSVTGLRVVGPLMLLQAGAQTAQVGVLLACFGIGPLLLAWRVGRLVDERGYRPPMALALALAVAASLTAVAASYVESLRLALLCVAAATGGAATQAGLIALQRTAARMAVGSAGLRSTFAWVGLAPSASNVTGPLAAGLLLDLTGPRGALLALVSLPLLAWWIARMARPPAAPPPGERQPAGTLRGLLGNPKVRRMMIVDLLTAGAWDVHTFVVPVLGHARGLSATAIGAVLGLFAAGVVAVRVAIPWIAHRLSEPRALAVSLLASAAVFAAYPLGESAVYMGVCGLLLGATLGVAQPMIMSTMHQAVPDDQRGGVLALRAIWVNLNAIVLPLGWAAASGVFGWTAMLWGLSALLGLGVRATGEPARRQPPGG